MIMSNLIKLKESGTKSKLKKKWKKKMGLIEYRKWIGGEWNMTPKNDLSGFFKNLVYCKLQV